jgi:hypothetical protein
MPAIQSVRLQTLVQRGSTIFSLRLLQMAERLDTLYHYCVLQVTKSVLSAVAEGLRGQGSVVENDSRKRRIERETGGGGGKFLR